MKKQPLRTPLEVTVDLPWTAYLPRDYVAGQRLRIEAYRRLARCASLDRLEDFRQELRDRYGPLPEPAEWLLRLAELRLLAAQWQDGDGPSGEGRRRRGRRRTWCWATATANGIREVADRSEGRLVVVDENSAYFRLRSEGTGADGDV